MLIIINGVTGVAKYGKKIYRVTLFDTMICSYLLCKSLFNMKPLISFQYSPYTRSIIIIIQHAAKAKMLHFSAWDLRQNKNYNTKNKYVQTMRFHTIFVRMNWFRPQIKNICSNFIRSALHLDRIVSNFVFKVIFRSTRQITVIWQHSIYSETINEEIVVCWKEIMLSPSRDSIPI